MKRFVLVLIMFFTIFATTSMAATLKLVISEPPGGR
jgi:hypothetical protein